MQKEASAKHEESVRPDPEEEKTEEERTDEVLQVEEQRISEEEGKDQQRDEEEGMKEHRRLELLAIARKSRLRWILEAREKKIDYSSAAENSSGKVSQSSKIEFYKKVPAAACLQEVVDFLVDMTVSDTNDDKEYINIETLAPSDTIDDELMDVSLEDLPTYDTMNELSPYAIFLEKLKHSSATEIVNVLRKFISKIEVYVRDSSYISHHVSITPTVSSSTTTNSISSTNARLDIPHEINEITESLEKMLRENILWSVETPAQFSETMVSLEKFIYHKLHPCLFPQILKSNLDKDEALKERIVSLSFLEPEHLDIVPLRKLPQSRKEYFVKLKQKLKIKENELVNESNIEMNTINLNMKNMQTEGLSEAVYLLKYTLNAECFSPTDKMSCLREISSSVIETISANQVHKKKVSNKSSNVPVTSPVTSNKKDLPGADDLLPALILAIKEANPPQLSSTIKFLEMYLSPKKLFSEAGYILTHFVSAIQFLENVNANALTISPLEFEESMYKCKHGGASRLRILQEENEMKERMLYKRAIQPPGSKKEIVVSDSKTPSTSQNLNLHDVYKRLSRHSCPPDEKHEKRHTRRSEWVPSDSVDQQANQKLIEAHRSFDASSGNSVIASWTKEDTASGQYRDVIGMGDASGSEALVNYFSITPDMLTMQDVPKILAEYKFLVKACAELSKTS